ncbi:AT-hook motif nuclear-localized protein 7-like [Argentina anserina]|uniref:AT-hook motif nuclear-localized protein 7-like n=1 Tax=Argentina anserina TaxID=57926 RepID=UPI002176821F|nr:AT-hook motif nuclear-localized protein 7-like [Potentilla anserina]
MNGCLVPRERLWYGQLAVTLAGADGRIYGGSVSDSMLAESSVHIVVGSFPIGDQRRRGKQIQAESSRSTVPPPPEAPAPPEGPAEPPEQPDAQAEPPAPLPVPSYFREDWFWDGVMEGWPLFPGM